MKINAITVPADSGDELARRFAKRAGAVDGTPGFEGFELLQPADDRTVWLVVTRWADEASYEAWVAGSDFARAHGGQRPADAGAEGRPQPGGEARQKPVGVSAEQWSYRVVDFDALEA